MMAYLRTHLQLSLAAFAGAVLFSCGREEFKEESVAVLGLVDKVAYIEERVKGDGSMYGEFGDLAVLDLNTGEKYYLTRDTYYDKGPVWSPDGESIAWFTKRSGARKLLAIQGISYPLEIFIFDLVIGRSRKVGSNLDRILSPFMRGSYRHLAYTNGGDALLVMVMAEVGDSTYRVPLNGDEATIVQNPPGAQWFGFFVFSAVSDTFAFFFKPAIDTDLRPNALSSLSSPFLKVIPESGKALLGNWSADGTKLLALGDKIVEYDRRADSVHLIDRPWDPRKLHVQRCYYTQTGKIVFLGSEILGSPDGPGGAPYTKPPEVYVFDKEYNTVRQVTNDGLAKDHLASCVIGTPWLVKGKQPDTR